MEISRCKSVGLTPCNRNVRTGPVTDPRIVLDRDDAAGIARITLNPEAPASRTLARDLLRASVIYLPLLLGAMMLNARGRLLF